MADSRSATADFFLARDTMWSDHQNHTRPNSEEAIPIVHNPYLRDYMLWYNVWFFCDTGALTRGNRQGKSNHIEPMNLAAMIPCRSIQLLNLFPGCECAEKKGEALRETA